MCIPVAFINENVLFSLREERSGGCASLQGFGWGRPVREVQRQEAWEEALEEAKELVSLSGVPCPGFIWQLLQGHSLVMRVGEQSPSQRPGTFHCLLSLPLL